LPSSRQHSDRQLVGEFAAAFARVAPNDPRVVPAVDADSLWAALASRLSPDAVILLKGSRGMRLERLVKPITEWATGAGEGAVAADTVGHPK